MNVFLLTYQNPDFFADFWACGAVQDDDYGFTFHLATNKLLKTKEKSFEYFFFFFSFSACLINLSDVGHLPSETDFL